jgi:hypothetical protein
MGSDGKKRGNRATKHHEAEVTTLMELTQRTPVLIQLGIIASMSVAASYAFMYTETAIQLDGLCFYRYVVYFAAIVLGFWCFSRYRKSVGLAFAVALVLIVFSPFRIEAVRFFPLAVPFLAVFMGVTSILAVPKSWGRGYFEFVVVLVLPALLAVSRIGGPAGLIATVSSIGYYELSFVTIVVVGGYFYLKYAALANLNKAKLLSNGGTLKDVADANRLGNILTARVLLGACGVTAVLMVAVPSVADAFRGMSAGSPLSALALELIAGMVAVTVLYLLRPRRGESVMQSQKK